MTKFKDDFLWGGSLAANQCEGAFDADGRGLDLMDVIPGGLEARQAAYASPLDYMNENIEYCPNRIAIDFYHRYKEDRWVSNVYVCQLTGRVYFRMEMKNNQMKKA